MVLTWQSCKLLLYKLASSYVQRFVTNYAGFRHTHTYIFLYIKACKYSVYMYVCKYISKTMNVRTMLFTFEYYNDALTFWRNRENLKILFFVFLLWIFFYKLNNIIGIHIDIKISEEILDVFVFFNSCKIYL